MKRASNTHSPAAGLKILAPVSHTGRMMIITVTPAAVIQGDTREHSRFCSSYWAPHLPREYALALHPGPRRRNMVRVITQYEQP